MLSPDDPEVWILRAPAAAELGTLDLSVLDATERARFTALARPRDRARYAFAHIALRTVLATRTGLPNHQLRFGRDPCPCCGAPHGRPVLRDLPGGPEFSLSHRGDLVVIGVDSEPIGVDVEPEPDEDTLAQVLPLLHPAERARVEAAEAGARTAVFATLWARKEAYLKGLGTGLGRDLAADDVTGDLPGWALTDLSAEPRTAVAVAVRHPVREVRRRYELPRGAYLGRPTSPVS
ncbi:4'-phosphopantetheinyl transferase superfamily protein [Streptomyces sp. NPDC047971]|uniref:4'-phosphopantetheinyl transferase family protein n=1 Tax=Streptomyces sp. NPDC047971 TaxID=3154499 RepID=UPI0033F58CFE